MVGDRLGFPGRHLPPGGRAALATKYRFLLNAATMLGQSKTVHQAEIDSACELIDFYRFNPYYMSQIFAQQPESSAATWNYLDYRALEGFVFAVTRSISPPSPATCPPRRR